MKSQGPFSTIRLFHDPENARSI